MPLFTKEDFMNPEVAQKLSVVIMNQMEKPVLTLFKHLKQREKKKFNELLNQYINSLGENWVDRLTQDFNETCHDELFDPDNFIKCENQSCEVGECELLLTDEQKQFQEDMKDPVKYKEWFDKLQESIIENERLAEEQGRVHRFNRDTPQEEPLQINV
jgi:hypothetical protein